jgi:hypothetical protein
MKSQFLSKEVIQPWANRSGRGLLLRQHFLSKFHCREFANFSAARLRLEIDDFVCTVKSGKYLAPACKYFENPRGAIGPGVDQPQTHRVPNDCRHRGRHLRPQQPLRAN